MSEPEIKPREIFRPADDVQKLLAAALRECGLKNKSLLINACIRQSLKHKAGKRIAVNQSDFERKIFEKGNQ